MSKSTHLNTYKKNTPGNLGDRVLKLLQVLFHLCVISGGLLLGSLLPRSLDITIDRFSNRQFCRPLADFCKISTRESVRALCKELQWHVIRNMGLLESGTED